MEMSQIVFLYLLVHFIGKVMLKTMQGVTYLLKFSGTNFNCQRLKFLKCQEYVQLKCVLITKHMLIPRHYIDSQAVIGIQNDFREFFRGGATPLVFFCCQDYNTSVFAPCLQILVALEEHLRNLLGSRLLILQRTWSSCLTKFVKVTLAY